MVHCPTRIRQIWFSVPKTLVTKYGFLTPEGQPIDPSFYEDDLTVPGAGWVKFFVPPSAYKRNVTDIRGGNFIRTSGGSFSSVATGVVGFSTSLVYSRGEFLTLILELYSISNASAYTGKVPIIVRDYVMPEWKDAAQGYTKRVGDIIPPIEPLNGGFATGRSGENSTTLLSGFSVNFIESSPRQL